MKERDVRLRERSVISCNAFYLTVPKRSFIDAS